MGRQGIQVFPFRLNHFILRAEVNAGIAQGTVFVVQKGDVPRFAFPGAVGTGIFVGTHATADAGFGVNEQFGIGEAPGVQNFQPVFQVRAGLLLLSTGMFHIQRALFHNIPEAFHEIFPLFLIQSQRQLKPGILFHVIEQFREGDVRRADAGAIVAAGTHQKSQCFRMGNFLPAGQSCCRFATGNGGSNAQ